MIAELLKSRIAIVGGGQFCKRFLELFHSKDFQDQPLTILGVADLNSHAQGIVYARQRGIFVTADFMDLLRLNNLQVLLELTGDPNLGSMIKKKAPAGIKILNTATHPHPSEEG